MSRIAAFLTIIVICTVTAVLAGPYEQVASPAPPTIQYGPSDNLAAILTGEIAAIEEENIHADLVAITEEAGPQTVPETVAPAGSRPAEQSAPQGDCENIPGWFPAHIAYRESHCSYDAYNPGGCGGNGCIGAYQFDSRHFFGWANGQSACGDLDPWTIEGQNECAWRLSREGTNFSPWGT